FPHGLNHLLCNFQLIKTNISRNKRLQCCHTQGNFLLKNPLQYENQEVFPTNSGAKLNHNVVSQHIRLGTVLGHFIKQLEELLGVPQISTGVQSSVVSSRVRPRILNQFGVRELANTASHRTEELQRFDRPIITGTG
ncbi:hypothetical protein PanWU01x14_089510, partial [Parasponia andersonii]